MKFSDMARIRLKIFFYKNHWNIHEILIEINDENLC